MGKMVLINSVDKVMQFVDLTRTISYDVDLKSGTHTYVDGKSILGIMSCDCRKPLVMKINADENELNDIYAQFEQFAV